MQKVADAIKEDYEEGAFFERGRKMVKEVPLPNSLSTIMVHTDKPAPEIIDTQMYHFPDCAHLMGFQLENTGLKIILDRNVPVEINEHFTKILLPFVEKNHLDFGDINHFTALTLLLKW